ncbi:SPW repeat protein [Streptomyces vinaceus]|uniref:SPW repeat protein n=1 Tax=Streptomyces vinaceus TaxID=1960 RepID=UPI0036C8332D
MERTHSPAWAAAAIGVWTCVAPWVVTGGVAQPRSITSYLIVGVIATPLALAAASGARDRDARRDLGARQHRSMAGNH